MTASLGASVHSLQEWVRGQGESNRGTQRSENQDAILVLETPDFHLYSIADGMGGVGGGALASRLAIASIEASARAARVWTDSTLSQAFHAAHERLLEESRRNETLANMGTTMVCAVFTRDRIMLANVGDSRAYALRDGKLHRLTEDHTLVADLVRGGVMTSEQARRNPLSHMLTQSLGSAEGIKVDAWVREGPCRGEKFLLCSDGLHSQVSEQEIEEICHLLPAPAALHALIQRANERGGQDNVSVIIVDVLPACPREVASSTQFRSVLEAEALPLSGDGEQDHMNGPDASSGTARVLDRITLGPIHGALLLLGALLSGMFIGSSVPLLERASSHRTQAVHAARTASLDEADQGRASFGGGGSRGIMRAEQALLDRAAVAASSDEEIRALLSVYLERRNEYLKHAQRLLSEPPNVEREQQVFDLLKSYQLAGRELDLALSGAAAAR